MMPGGGAAARRAGRLLLVCLAFPISALAGIQDIESANNQVSAQFQSMDMDRTEIAGGTVLNTEDGQIRGAGLSASLMKDLWLGHDFLAAQYASCHGQTTYVGGTIGNPAYGSLIGRSGAKIQEFSIRYGSGYVIDPEIMLTPYGELGYHKYDRTLGYSTPGSYLETYTHPYYGIGVMGQISIDDKLVWSANVLIGRTARANINVELPAPFGFSSRLGNSTLYRVGIAMDYAFAKSIHASIGAESTSWKYGASAPQPPSFGISLYEPDSKTNNAIVRAGIGYAF